MKFNTQLVKKAWAIFKAICPVNADKEMIKIYLSEAYKSAIRFFKGLLNGVLTFFKLAKDENSDVEVTTRNVKPFVYVPSESGKTGRKLAGNTFICIDSDKNTVISFNHFQLM